MALDFTEGRPRPKRVRLSDKCKHADPIQATL